MFQITSFMGEIPRQGGAKGGRTEDPQGGLRLYIDSDEWLGC
jgi:hypothetical protein